MEILTERQIKQKTRRIAIDILERNYGEDRIILAGVNDNGYYFAEMLKAELEAVSDTPIQLTRIRLNPANPLAGVELEISRDALKRQVVIVVDDVANTGRTTFYAMRPLFDTLPKKVEVAVLVNREHKLFPVSCNYVGLSLATTLNENIIVQLERNKMAVHLS